MEKVTFVLSDESVNKIGFRVLTDGIDISSFVKNPVMLYCHLRASKDHPTPLLPIGRWENVRKENKRLLGEAVFDLDDAFAVKVASKVSKSILNTASIAIDLVEVSEDPAVMLPGQTMPSVTKSVLQEVSIADIPGNGNAVRLCNNGHGLMSELTNRDGSETEYERLWKSNQLASLKLRDPRKFSVLETEFLVKVRERKAR